MLNIEMNFEKTPYRTGPLAALIMQCLALAR